ERRWGRLPGARYLVGPLVVAADPRSEHHPVAVSPDLQPDLGTRRLARDGPREIPGLQHGQGSDGKDDVAGAQPGPGRAAALVHGCDERAARAVESERAGQRVIDLLDGDAEAAAGHPAGGDDLRL